jgi:anthranilate 1,2-dioxygenase small subunit
MTSAFDQKLLLRLRIEVALADYMHTIDSDRLEDWSSHFTKDGRYRVTTRENYDHGLPLCLITCEGGAMMNDRIIALRTANIYEPHVYCHVPGALRITTVSESFVSSESTFIVVRTMSDGAMDVFACGRSFDTFDTTGDNLMFRERTVVLDSRQIHTLLVIPL